MIPPLDHRPHERGRGVSQKMRDLIMDRWRETHRCKQTQPVVRIPMFENQHSLIELRPSLSLALVLPAARREQMASFSALCQTISASKELMSRAVQRVRKPESAVSVAGKGS